MIPETQVHYCDHEEAIRLGYIACTRCGLLWEYWDARPECHGGEEPRADG